MRALFPGVSRRFVPGLCVVGLLASDALLAQQPAGPGGLTEPGSTTVGRIGDAPQPTFLSGVTLVTTDVIVRDPTGLFIPDLTKDDFQILEDGIEQSIESLVLVHGGRVYNQLQPTAPPQEGIVLPTARPANETAGRIFVLFLDDLHLTSEMTPRVRQVFTTLIETLIHEGDLFGIISTGPSSLSIDMTYDRGMLYAARDRITGDGLSVWDTVNMLSMNSRGGPAEVTYRAHVAFKTAREVLRNLEQVTNRRKVFIYFSHGYDFNPFADSRLNNTLERDMQRAQGGRLGGGGYTQLTDPLYDPFERQLRQGRAFAETDLAIELGELARVANRANTSFYSVDPRGLIAGPAINDAISLGEWNRHIFQTQNSLRILSELTGGTAIINRNDFDDAFREIDAETSDYYVLGFYTSNPDPTIRTRELEVGVRERPDLEIKARTEYSLARPPA